MSSVVGKVNMNTNTGVFNVGDVSRIIPEKRVKTFVGPGYGNTSEKLTYYNNTNKTIIKTIRSS